MTTEPIRLACAYCSREELDGITPEQLAQCRKDGWTDITVVQSHEESCRTYDNPADAPPGFDVTAWYTHLGVCPDCREE